MKFKRELTLLTTIIIALSAIASAIGIFSIAGKGKYEFQSIRGETVIIYGKGIYKNDSIAAVAQGIPQDIVTLLVGIPLLILSLYLLKKNYVKGKLLLTGTLGYFLYTYMSYTFLWNYNNLFLIYVMLMSLSFFAFTLSMISFDINRLKLAFKKELPIKFIGGYQIFVGIAIGLLWLGRIAPSITGDTAPLGLEHYTTLVIQGMDLGFVVPVAILSGILLIKRKAFGYLLSSVVIIKGITLLTAITAMIVSQAYAGVPMILLEVIIFLSFDLVSVYCLIVLMRNIDEKIYIEKEID
jgi:hypothetical protein